MNLLVLSILILFLLSFIDNAIHAFAEKTRRSIRKSSFLTIGILLSIDTFLALEFLVNPNIILNLAVSILVFLVFLGVLVNPFKRKKIYSFLYWGAIFFLLSVIVYYMSLSGWSWGIFAFGILLYPFIFMLEELKRLINEFIDILEKLGRAIKAAIVKFFRSMKKFLITHFKVIRIFLCAIVGIFFGVLFSDLILAILNPFHATLLGMAVFGILFGIIPSGKAETVDEAFNQKMKRFITIWVSLTGFVVVLILPYIESVIFSIFLVISSVLGLSAILLIYLYRKEKKEKFSVRWRFYTTIASIVLAVIWVALLLLFYFLEVRV